MKKKVQKRQKRTTKFKNVTLIKRGAVYNITLFIKTDGHKVKIS